MTVLETKALEKDETSSRTGEDRTLLEKVLETSGIRTEEMVPSSTTKKKTRTNVSLR